MAPLFTMFLTAGALDAHDQNDLAAYDTYANRPAAGTPGRIFLPTDGIFIEQRQRRDLGQVWTNLANDPTCGGGFCDLGEPRNGNLYRQQGGGFLWTPLTRVPESHHADEDLSYAALHR